MFGNIGMKEIIIIAVVLLVLFGSRKIPELSKSLVESIRHLRGAFKDAPTENNDKKKS
jgi:sec-independent protein translocase protein TatA